MHRTLTKKRRIEGSQRIVMTKSKVRVREITRPRIVFTPGVTKGDLAKLHHKPTELTAGAILDLRYIEEEDRTSRRRRATGIVLPDPDQRWSYHHSLEIFDHNKLIDRGLCTRATWDEKGRLQIRWDDFAWDFDLINVRYLAMLNMADAIEQAYWGMCLIQHGKSPNMHGYVPDKSRRVFQYAVPLAGLSNKNEKRLVGHTDFGITCSDAGDPINRQMERLTREADGTAWGLSVPKVYGAVAARSPIEAERYALRRAQFAADVLTFALHAGASHFDTLHDSRSLDWSGKGSRTTVSTQPWILLVEQSTLKGWLRTTPLTFTDKKVELGTVSKRARTFLDGFRRVAETGDGTDQAEPGARGSRERRIARAVQTAIHWLAVAARMPEEEYRLIPIWTALEAVISAIEYPPVFGNRRKHIRRALFGGH